MACYASKVYEIAIKLRIEISVLNNAHIFKQQQLYLCTNNTWRHVIIY